MFFNQNYHLLAITKLKSKIINEAMNIEPGTTLFLNYFPISNDKLIISFHILLDYLLENTQSNTQIKPNIVVIDLSASSCTSLRKSVEDKLKFAIFDVKNDDFFEAELKFIFKYSKYEDTFYKYLYNDLYSDVNMRLSFNSFAVLEISKNSLKTKRSFDGFNYQNYINSIMNHSNTNAKSINKDHYYKADKIICINNSLSNISFLLYNNSITHGRISLQLFQDTLLLDINSIPGSTFSNIYIKKTMLPIAVTLPILSTKNTYTPLTFSLKLEFLLNHMIELNFPIPQLKIKFPIYKSIDSFDVNIEKNVFVLYNSNTYGSCFYLSNGLLLTNKHIIEDDSKKEWFISNSFLKHVKVEVFYVSESEIDIALLRISVKNTDFHIKTLSKMKNSRISTGKSMEINEKVYSLSYNYFPISSIFTILSPSYSSGTINKIVLLKDKDYLFNINTTNYSGASGCPIFDSFSNEIIGMMFANIAFQSNNGKIEIGYICQCISGRLIKEIDELINKHTITDDDLGKELKKIDFLKKDFVIDDLIMRNIKF